MADSNVIPLQGNVEGRLEWCKSMDRSPSSVARTGILFGGGGCSTNSVEDRGQRMGPWGRSPLVRGSEGSCNLVQEISFHIVKFS